MQETQVNKKTVILVALFLTQVLFVPQSFASGTTHVSTFSGGAYSITVTSDGNNTSTDLQLDLERNVTYQDASFVIESQSTLASPGNVWINSSSGDTIWTFSDMGYGNLSQQNTFFTGSTFEAMPLNNSTERPRVLIPRNASIQSSHANITYTPQIEAQYIPIGVVTAMELGDSNGDNLTDAFVLSLENLTTGVNTGLSLIHI